MLLNATQTKKENTWRVIARAHANKPHHHPWYNTRKNLTSPPPSLYNLLQPNMKYSLHNLPSHRHCYVHAMLHFGQKSLCVTNRNLNELNRQNNSGITYPRNRLEYFDYLNDFNPLILRASNSSVTLDFGNGNMTTALSSPGYTSIIPLTNAGLAMYWGAPCIDDTPDSNKLFHGTWKDDHGNSLDIRHMQNGDYQLKLVGPATDYIELTGTVSSNQLISLSLQLYDQGNSWGTAHLAIEGQVGVDSAAEMTAQETGRLNPPEAFAIKLNLSKNHTVPLMLTLYHQRIRGELSQYSFVYKNNGLLQSNAIMPKTKIPAPERNANFYIQAGASISALFGEQKQALGQSSFLQDLKEHLKIIYLQQIQLGNYGIDLKKFRFVWEVFNDRLTKVITIALNNYNIYPKTAISKNGNPIKCVDLPFNIGRQLIGV